MWVNTLIQIIFIFVCSLVPFCGAMNNCGEIIMYVIYVVPCVGTSFLLLLDTVDIPVLSFCLCLECQTTCHDECSYLVSLPVLLFSSTVTNVSFLFVPYKVETTCEGENHRSCHRRGTTVCTFGTGRSVHGLLPDICTLWTVRYLHGMLSCLQPWNRCITQGFQIVAPMEELDHVVVPDVCTFGKDKPMFVPLNR
jgi:hypothetical protein